MMQVELEPHFHAIICQHESVQRLYAFLRLKEGVPVTLSITASWSEPTNTWKKQTKHTLESQLTVLATERSQTKPVNRFKLANPRAREIDEIVEA